MVLPSQAFTGGNMQFTLSEHSIVTIVLFIVAYLIAVAIFIIKNVFDHRALRKEFEKYVADNKKVSDHTDSKFDKLIKVMEDMSAKWTNMVERLARNEERVNALEHEQDA